MDEFHRSVMCEEIVHALSPQPQGIYADGTLGGGGHTEALLEAGAGKVIALDMDGEALAYAGRRLACFVERLSLHHTNFAHLDEVLEDEGVSGLQGTVLDLGLSRHQVKKLERGFSYREDGVLDMRFDSSAVSPTALDIIRSQSRDNIRKILKDFGEEPRAERIAREICARRKEIETTGDLAALLRKIVGERGFRKTAMRVFQALRIAVNNELSNLKQGLEAGCFTLSPGGRLAVISYHSLEDRITKNNFRDKERKGGYERINRKPIYPSADEVKENPAARSAKLRILERK